MDNLSIDEIEDPASFNPTDKQRDILQQEKQDLQKQRRNIEKKIGLIDVALSNEKIAEEEMEFLNHRLEQLTKRQRRKSKINKKRAELDKKHDQDNEDKLWIKKNHFKVGIYIIDRKLLLLQRLIQKHEHILAAIRHRIPLWLTFFRPQTQPLQNHFSGNPPRTTILNQTIACIRIRRRYKNTLNHHQD